VKKKNKKVTADLNAFGGYLDDDNVDFEQEAVEAIFE